MDPNAIRIVNKLTEDPEAGNVEHLVRVFGQISKVPRNVKSFTRQGIPWFPLRRS